MLTEICDQVQLTFLHYPLNRRQEFLPVNPQPTVTDLDRAFARYPGELIFYGHHHPFSDRQGRARYINPGSLGCAPIAEARFCVVDIAHGHWNVTHWSVPYDDTPLYHAFEARAVPEPHLHLPSVLWWTLWDIVNPCGYNAFFYCG